MNNHQFFRIGYSICFWKDNTASDEENANRVVVNVGPPGMPYPQFEFSWPDQKFEVERLERAFAVVQRIAVHVAKTEIRAALGIQDAH